MTDKIKVKIKDNIKVITVIAGMEATLIGGAILVGIFTPISLPVFVPILTKVILI